jgi:hypothetical protein
MEAAAGNLSAKSGITFLKDALQSNRYQRAKNANISKTPGI